MNDTAGTPEQNSADHFDGTRGVYFIANNHVLDMAIAFLASFRCFNSDIKLCLIPYDDKFDQIEALQSEFGFEIYRDQDVLKACDDISNQFHGHTVGAYRKLAAWTGPFDEFLYIDIDTIVHDSVDFVFDQFQEADILTSHSNNADTRKWVWKDSIDGPTVGLSQKQIAYAANTGFIVCRKASMDFSWMQSRVAAGLKIKDDMELGCMEQPFLNYLIVTSGNSYSSFGCIELDWEFPRELWAGTPGAKLVDGELKSPWGGPVLFIHWAGVWRARESLDEMPYRDLWLHFRNMNTSLPAFL